MSLAENTENAEESMKAAVIEEPGTLMIRDLPVPEPGEYGALCELLYGATCAGTDQHLILGHPPFCNWIKLPAILGHESIGRVTEIGSKVSNLSVGDLVTRVGAPATADVDTAWGGFAEYGVALDWRAMEADGVPRGEWYSAMVNNVLPEDFDPRMSTMIITWRETLSYLQRMGFGPGKSLAVLGSGGNGLSYIAHARNLGGTDLVMVGAMNRRRAAEMAGSSAFIDYRADDVKEQALALNADGFDFVIDAVGKASLADLGLGLLKAGGTIGIYGMDEAADIRLDPSQARGSFTLNKNGYAEVETHEQVIGFIEAGKLDASVWLALDHVFELTDINAAFDAVKNREMVKALVRLSG